MKLAVTYENDQVFQHFGKTQQFKIYEVEDGQVLSAAIVDTAGAGHEALAGFLAEQGVSAVLCGGLGDGAQAALAEASIEVISGVQGSCDEAVVAYLAGTLVSQGVNCDHHHEETEEASGGCGGCGGGCGGCGGCGGKREPLFEGPNAGKVVRVHYRGTFNDGSEFDSSFGRGEPLEFTCAEGMMIPGFDKAVVDMVPGEVKNIHLMPAEAYGEIDPSAIFDVKIAELPGSEDAEVGMMVGLMTPYGQQIPVKVAAKTEDTITFDANHEMAGKELNFEIELVEIVG